MKNNHKKTLLGLVLGAFLTLSSLVAVKSNDIEVKADDQTITLNASNCSSVMGGSYSSDDFSYGGLSFGRNYVAVMSSTIQIKAGTANGVWNTSTVKDTYISKVELSVKTNTASLCLGSDSKPTVITKSATGANNTYTFTESDDYHFFSVFATSKYTQINSLKVTFSSSTGGGGTTGGDEGGGGEDTPTDADYTLITDASTLLDGEVVVIGCAEKKVVAGEFDSTYLSAVSGTFKDGGLKTTEALEITLEKNNDNWNLLTEDGYIGSTAVKSLSLGTKTDWSISIKEGVATIEATSLGKIQYNAGSPRFANYTSAQTSIELYKKATGGGDTPVTKYTLTYDANGGTGTTVDSNSPYIENKVATIIANSFTAPNGKQFKEWNTSADGSGTSYKVGDTIQMKANVTLFAIWEDKPTLSGNVYTLVTNTNQLSAGDKVIFAYIKDKVCKVSGALQEKYVSVTDAIFVDNQISSDDALTFDLGISENKYSFKTGENYLYEKSGDLYHTKTANYWTVSFSDDYAVIKYLEGSTEKDPIRYNASSPRFKTYANGQQVIYLYKLAGKASEVKITSTKLHGNVGQTLDLVANTTSIDSPSYVWTIETGNDIVAINKGANTNTLTLDLLKEGEANIKVKVNDQYEDTVKVTVTDYSYDLLDATEYFIANSSGKGVLGGDLSNKEEIDFTSNDDVFTFEKAYEGDNTYWIKKGDKYLTYGRDVNPSKSASAIILNDTKVNYWTITENNNVYKVKTHCNYDSKNRSLAQNTSDWKWYAFEGNNYVSLIEKGDLVFKEFEIAHKPSLAYLFLGDDFSNASKRSGLVVNAVFTNGYKKDVTDEISWGKLTKEGTVTGTITINGEVKTVTVEEIPVYLPVEGSLTVTGIKDKYLIGEEVKGLTVKVDWQKGTSSPETRTVDKADYTVSPTVISADTTKIRVSLNVDPTNIYLDTNIEVKENKWVPAQTLNDGDEILFTSGNYEGIMTSSPNTNYLRLSGKTFETSPVGEAVFEVEKEGTSYYFKDKVSGQYLNTGVDDILSFGKTETIDFYNDECASFPFKIPGDDNLYHAEIAYQNGSYNGIYYFGDEYYIDQFVQLVLDLKQGSNDEMTLSLSGCYSDGTIIDCTVDYKIYAWDTILQLVNPYKTTVGEKTAFNCTYHEPESLEESPWWDISWSGGHIGFNGTKFETELTKCGQDMMLYRNKDIEIQDKVTSLKASSLYEDQLKVKKGESFNWSLVVVTATFESGATAKIPTGSYEVSGLDTSTVGKQTVTISYGNKTTTIQILVTGAVDHVEITNKDVLNRTNFYVGNDFTLQTQGINAPEEEPLEWSSSNTNIVSVDQNGKISGVAPGKATVTVKDYYELFSDSIEVTVLTRETGVKLDKETADVYVNKTITLVATILPEGAQGTLNWMSSDTNVATVSNGVVTGKKVGTATITVTTNKGNSASCVVTVKNMEVTGVSLNKTSATIEEGKTLELIATITPNDATNKDVIWSSDNEEIATVSQDGVVTAIKEGTATISVKTSDGNKTATCVVTVVAKEVDPEPTPKPSEEKSNGCGGSIIMCSSMISILSLAGITLLTKKRK